MQEQIFADFDYLKDHAQPRAMIRYLLDNYVGMRLSELARKHGLCEVTLGYTVNGRRRNPRCMVALSRELGIHTSELFPKNGSGKGAR